MFRSVKLGLRMDKGVDLHADSVKIKVCEVEDVELYHEWAGMGSG